jgi:hypothetical protein
MRKMDKPILDGDFLIESGRSAGGRMFVRVMHEPTTTSRVQVGLNQRSYAAVVADLRGSIEAELIENGWIPTVTENAN